MIWFIYILLLYKVLYICIFIWICTYAKVLEDAKIPDKEDLCPSSHAADFERSNETVSYLPRSDQDSELSAPPVMLRRPSLFSVLPPNLHSLELDKTSETCSESLTSPWVPPRQTPIRYTSSYWNVELKQQSNGNIQNF